MVRGSEPVEEEQLNWTTTTANEGEMYCICVGTVSDRRLKAVKQGGQLREVQKVGGV